MKFIILTGGFVWLTVTIPAGATQTIRGYLVLLLEQKTTIAAPCSQIVG